MVDACKLLGVDIMTGHWEFTYGMERVKEIVEKDFQGKVEFLAQNVKTTDFGDPVFKPYTLREINGVSCAIIGQAFPYTPIANPRYMVADWSFGIQDDNMQKMVDEVRAKGAQVVVVLSHNGMDVDLQMASRVRGIDAIFGGHTHDGVPVAVPVSNAGGKTLVTNAGSNGKFLGVMDFDVKGGKVADFRYRLLPVFANQLQADPDMEALITRVRQPYEAKLAEKLAVTDGLLYRRGNFNGSWDQLICDALMQVQGAEIAFSPGFRWGTSLLPGDTITRELMMDQLAITYPYATVNDMSGETIKTVLEDVADNLFNPDPYYQQGGDMVRVGGLAYTCDPVAEDGQPHLRHAAWRQADRGRQDLQGCRLGAGGRGGQDCARHATGLGRGRDLAQVAGWAGQAAQTQCADAGRVSRAIRAWRLILTCDDANMSDPTCWQRPLAADPDRGRRGAARQQHLQRQTDDARDGLDGGAGGAGRLPPPGLPGRGGGGGPVRQSAGPAARPICRRPHGRCRDRQGLDRGQLSHGHGRSGQ